MGTAKVPDSNGFYVLAGIAMPSLLIFSIFSLDGKNGDDGAEVLGAGFDNT